ncbi:hypothetical protein [Polymorphospora sp. NPDC050346]|uniref:hypothetical protein n=1 Tax=Polymorphospora sp. NPDC050346 TaxID=3155780 RepID=UPI00340FE5B9
MTTRADLPANPAAAHAAVLDLLDENRREGQQLRAVRAAILRELAATNGGDIRATAQQAGVSDMALRETLVADLVRTIHAATATAGISRNDYKIDAGSKAHPARVTLALTGDAPDEGDDDIDPYTGNRPRPGVDSARIGRMNEASNILTALNKAGLESADADGFVLDVGNAGPIWALAQHKPVTVTWKA